MSAVMDAPAATGTRIAELTRDGVTLRLSVTDGQPWIALERDHDGRTQCIAMELDEDELYWLRCAADELDTDDFTPEAWQELEP